MQDFPMKPIRQLDVLRKVKVFSNVHYVRIRTKVPHWIATHPDVKIIKIQDFRSPPHPLTPITKTIKIFYEEG